MNEKEKIIELITLFEFFKEFESANILKNVTGRNIANYYKVHFKNAVKDLNKISNSDIKFKNDGSITEFLEMKIWVIVNRYKNEYYSCENG